MATTTKTARKKTASGRLKGTGDPFAVRIAEKDYIPAQRVAEDPEMRESVLDKAHSDFLAWKQRYERYAEFMQEFKHVIAAYKKLAPPRATRRKGRAA